MKWQILAPSERPGHALCRCECGTERVVRLDNIERGYSRSCGCTPRQRKARVEAGRRLAYDLVRMAAPAATGDFDQKHCETAD